MITITEKNGKRYAKGFVPHSPEKVSEMMALLKTADTRYFSAVTLKTPDKKTGEMEVRFFTTGQQGVVNGAVPVTGEGNGIDTTKHGLIGVYLPHEIDPKKGTKGIRRYVKVERLLYAKVNGTTHYFTDDPLLLGIVKEEVGLVA